jgi:hypothetical protein
MSLPQSVPSDPAVAEVGVLYFPAADYASIESPGAVTSPSRQTDSSQVESAMDAVRVVDDGAAGPGSSLGSSVKVRDAIQQQIRLLVG